MRRLVLLCLLAGLTAGQVVAQTAAENIFLSRDFWKESPDVATVKQKIAEGNDPVQLNPYAFDAICYAILEDTPLTTIEYLLSLPGNEVDKVTHDGRNYLLWAGYKGNIPLMKLLIDKGSDTKLIDDHGYNLMAFTAVGGQEDPEVYDLILANGGKIDDGNRAGATALMLLAPKTKDEKAIKYFLGKGLDLKATDVKGNNLFAYAARVGNRYLMDYLIERGVDYKQTNAEGGNAMLWAANGYRRTINGLPLFRYLDSLGLAADVVTATGDTPLHGLAYQQKDLAIFKFFLDMGVDPNQVNEAGNTALLNAARANNMEAIKILQPLTEDINHKNTDGFSALTHATRRLALESVEVLVAAGADVHFVDAENRNMVTHLFDVYRPRDEEKFVALLDFATKHQVAAPTTFGKGDNLLHLAVTKGYLPLIEKAIEFNSNINQKNADGLTPLHLAAMKAQDEQILKMLIKRGADPKILTDFEESAFDLATENELLDPEAVDLNFLKLN
ncbi:MAG: ankyrin repeat domain-containing protein [Bacteroidota bacterium]